MAWLWYQLKRIISHMRKHIFKFFIFQILNHVIVQCQLRKGVQYTSMITRKSRIEARDAVVRCCTLLDYVASTTDCCLYSQLLPLQPTVVLRVIAASTALLVCCMLQLVVPPWGCCSCALAILVGCNRLPLATPVGYCRLLLLTPCCGCVVQPTLAMIVAAF